MTRGEPWDLNHLPQQVISLQLGCDCHDQFLTVVIVGIAQCDPDKTPETFVLAHVVIRGHLWDFTSTSPWRKLQGLLLKRWPHPLGGSLGIDAAFIDAGDGTHQPVVMRFVAGFARNRHVWAGRGVPYADANFVKTETKTGRPFALAHTTGIKGDIFGMIENERGLRFSNTLSEEFNTELASEHQVIHVRQGQEVRQYEKLTRHTANHSLDALVYAISVRDDIWRQLSANKFAFANDRVHATGCNVPRAAMEAPAEGQTDEESVRRLAPAISTIEELLKHVDSMSDEQIVLAIETLLKTNPALAGHEMMKAFLRDLEATGVVIDLNKKR
jgi:phage terminase large subunit GpA-like protein